jgi:hypothetical protein
MGYYDTQHVTPNAGGQPYNVRDILLATQGVTGGLDKLVADAGADRKAQQQMKANQYVSGLLGKATPENYQQQLLQAGSMAPYASAEMMKQVDTSRAGFQRGEDKKYQLDRDTIGDAFKTGEFIQHGDEFKQNLQTQRDQLKQQLDVAKMQEGGANSRAAMQVKATMAGIDNQIKAQDRQMEKLALQQQYQTQVANKKAVSELLGGIDVAKGVQSDANKLLWFHPQNTSGVYTYGSDAKALLLKNADGMTPEQARYFNGLMNEGKFGKVVGLLRPRE